MHREELGWLMIFIYLFFCLIITDSSAAVGQLEVSWIKCCQGLDKKESSGYTRDSGHGCETFVPV